MSNRVDKITAQSRQKIYFSDFTNNFDLNPITGNLMILTNTESVKQSIKNLVLTINGERFYHPEIGSAINASNFNLVDDLTTNKIKSTIENTLKNFEPRAQSVQVNVTADPINNLYKVNVQFTTVNFPNQVFNAPVILRVR